MLEVRKRTTPHYPKSFPRAILLCALLGLFGIHRFYTGYKRLGLAQLIMFCSFAIMYGIHKFYTESKIFFIMELILLCGLGIWWLIDLFSLSFNAYKDKYGIELEDYNGTLASLVLTGVVLVFLAMGIMSLPYFVEKMM